MLLRGSRLQRGHGHTPGGTTEALDATVKQPRVLPRTAMYPEGAYAGGGGEEVVGLGAEAARLARVMGDRHFHADLELLEGSSSAFVLAALGELLETGYAFDRSGRSLRLRARGMSETPQDLATVTRGLFVVVSRGEDSSDDGDPEEDRVVEEVSRVPEASSIQEVVREPGLVLSDPPEHLTIPLSHLGSMVGAILAKRGVGKTYLGMVLVEEIMGVDPPVPVVVFDPTGVWWGLCATETGAPSSYEVLLLGGPRGHLPLTPLDGSKIAEVVATEKSARVVVDLSQMAPAEQHGVVADFCERLISLPHFAIHVVFDEADEFAPQRFGAGAVNQRRALGFVERLVMRGRSRGIGVTLISLRPAVISKNVLSQVDALYLLRMAEPADVEAVRSRLEKFESGISPEMCAQCIGNLPVLARGTSYFLRGGDEVMFRRFRVRRKRTFDASGTPEVGKVLEATLGRPNAAVLQAARKIFAGRVAK